MILADRIAGLYAWLRSEGLEGQFHPNYTRMVPAHHVVEIQLVGCPDPEPTYTRFFTPQRNRASTDLDELSRAYIGALADEVAQWLQAVPERERIGVSFSGGIDSGAVFLTTYHVLRRPGMNPSRLKAFTLSIDGGPDLAQAHQFLDALGLGLFLKPIDVQLDELDVVRTLRVVEDYKPLDCPLQGSGPSLT